MKKRVRAIIKREIDEEEHILLLKKVGQPYEGHWYLPGGEVYSGELVGKAIKDRVKEETGLIFIGSHFSDFKGVHPDPVSGPKVLVYEGYGFGESNASKWVGESKWFEFFEALQLQLAFGHEEIISSYLERGARGHDKESLLAEAIQTRNESLRHSDNKLKILLFSIALFVIWLFSMAYIGHHLVMFYPIISIFLASLWIQSDLKMATLENYSGGGSERQILNTRNSLTASRERKFSRRIAKGFFMTSQIIAIVFPLILLDSTNRSLGRSLSFPIIALGFIGIIASYWILSLKRKS